jgi:hypothetical protein
VEESGCGLIWSTILPFAWKDWEKTMKKVNTWCPQINKRCGDGVNFNMWDARHFHNEKTASDFNKHPAGPSIDKATESTMISNLMDSKWTLILFALWYTIFLLLELTHEFRATLSICEP